MNKLFDSTRIRRISKYIFLFVWLLLVFGLLSASCEPSKDDDLENEGQFVNPPDPGESGSLESAQSEGYLEDEPMSNLQEDPGVPIADLETNEGELPKKPVGFVNYGTINATVRPWTYVPLGANEPQTPAPTASTVSSAQGTGGDWPNSSRFISVPLGTYTWCIDWEEEDQDGDGYFDYYHYIDTGPTLLDENDSDELEFAEEVAISAPPDTGVIYKGKCGVSDVIASCYGKSTYFQAFVRCVTHEPIYPLDILAWADTAHEASPAGIDITFSSSAGSWYGWKILYEGDWIEATTSDSYSAMGVQIFGDRSIGYGTVYFDGMVVWAGDASESVIDSNEGWYGVYVEIMCPSPGTHTIRVEAGPGKEVSGWGGAVPVSIFGYRR